MTAVKQDYELLIFDWDGTVMDSVARIVSCLHRAAVDAGGNVPPREALRDVIGLGLREAILALFPAADEAFIERYSAAYRDYFLGGDDTPSPLYAGARETLTGLRQQGYYLAVATGKSRRGLDRVLEETGLGDLFAVTRCADETFSKPHPQMLHEILTDLDTQPGAALMIGDSEYDVLMGQNAGVDALAVSYGVHSLERLQAHRTVGYIEAITELPAWLDQRLPEAAGA
ncbi:MAG: HAD-IA family hydrolase [Gammaproteobacteria bacterium]|jgi:phosphoglycolate phosphatase